MEIAWAAGLFEGEGSISAKRLQLKMISEPSVRRFGAAVGVGRVYGPYGPYESQLGKTPYFMWVAQNRDDVLAVAEILVPYMTAPFAERLREVLA